MARPMVTRDPATGTPYVDGTQVYATTVRQWLDAGHTLSDVRRSYPMLPAAWMDTLATFPALPRLRKLHGEALLLMYPDGVVRIEATWWTPEEIPVLCAALTAAAEASRQWQRDVDAWIAAHMIEEAV